MRSLGPGAVLEGKYRIRELIGSGGMGVVYAAERVTLGDTVAVKCILAEKNNETNRDRFLREAQAAARIRHPNVVQVFDFGSPSTATPYMVMEYLEGPTLAEVLRTAGRLSVDRALTIFARICSAVGAGHRRGVVHRDVKPGNVILARSDDGRDAVKVLDFGLACIVDEPSVEVTQPGLLVGTVSYMAPEQIAGGNVSPASDVFSLSVLLYQMVTGKLPFADGNHVAMLFRISQGDYEAADKHVSDLPDTVLEAIAAGLTVDPKKRPRSPEALAELAGVTVSDRGDSQDFSSDELRRSSTHSSPLPISVEGHTLADAVPRAKLDDSVFVGRGDPLALLRREHDAASSEVGRIALILGDAGIGKTRLVEQLVSRLPKDTKVLHGRFFAYEGDRPPAYEALRWLLAGGDSGAGSGDPAMRPGAAPPDDGDKWAVFARLAEQFVERAGDKRLLLAIDDLQWATALDLEFLAYLPHAMRPHRVTIVGTARPEASDELRRWQTTLARQRALRTIQLAPLSLEEQRAWLKGFFGRLRIRPRDVRRIHHVTAGNPFALIEVVRQLVDSGRITETEQGWACEDLYDVGLPDTVHDLFHARIDAMPEAMRSTLETACVVGEQFRFETLQTAGDFDEVELERTLEDAVKRRILTDRDLAPGSDYRFASEGLRRVLYDDLPPRARKRLHKRVVAALSQLYADEQDTRRIAGVLAYHHRAIEEWGPTLMHALAGVREQLSSHAHDAAETSIAYAVEAADVLGADGVTPEQWAVLHFARGTLSARVGRLERGQAELERAVEAAEELGDQGLTVDAMLELAECHLSRGQFADGVAVGMRCIGVAQGLGDRRREYTARVQVARCACPLGRLDDAEAIIAPVLACADSDLATIRAFALRERALVSAKRGSFAAAIEAANEAVVQARAGGDSLSEYRATSALGLVQAECGHYGAAQLQLQRALELAQALSLRRREGIELCNLGETVHLSGDTIRGLELVRAGLTIFVEIADRASEGDCRVNIGRMLLALGRTREAAEMLEEGRRACAASGRAEYEGIALCALAELRLGNGELLAAQSSFEEARRILSSGGTALVWQAELGLARTASMLGHAEAARRHAVRALGLVDAQLSQLPAGQRSQGLGEARSEILRFVSDDSPTQTMG